MKGYDVGVCDHCGGAFADRIPPPEAFDRYYADMSKYEYADTAGKESPYDERRFDESAKSIAEAMPDRDLRIIDIGCATGGQLAALKRLGYHRLLGMDPSPACAAAAKRLYDIQVFTQCLSSIESIPSTFDLAILSGILEHLANPAQMLRRLAGRLADGGTLFVLVPDVAGFADALDAPFQQFSTEHVNFFSQQSLHNLMAVSGFEPIRVKKQVFAQSLTAGMPTVVMFARKVSSPRPMEKDQESLIAVGRYIDASEALERRIASRIDELASQGRPILVWGVGTHTQHLLAMTRLGQANIVAFVDSNPHYQGKRLAGREILSAAAAAGRPEPILISSCVLQEEIARQIRQSLGLTNELICLYDRPSFKGGGS
jgi:SAM-dependent methyltransferase